MDYQRVNSTRLCLNEWLVDLQLLRPLVEQGGEENEEFVKAYKAAHKEARAAAERYILAVEDDRESNNRRNM